MSTGMVKLRRQLSEDGSCYVPGGAPAELTNQIRKIADRLASQWQDAASPQEKGRLRLRGSLLDVWRYPELAPMITLPSALQALDQLGFANPKFYSGYIIRKPPETAPALFWHQDGFKWNAPISYTDPVFPDVLSDRY